MNPARAAFDAVTRFALPPRCAGCGVIVDGDHRLCAACWGGLDFLANDGCARCGQPLAGTLAADLVCGPCIASPPAHDGVRAAVAYDAIARTIVLKLKYGGRASAAEFIARLLARHLDPAEAGVLIPVPLHRRRIWTRGYNQAALIARALARRTGSDLLIDGLVRVRHTPVLQGIGAHARAKAVRGAFRVGDRHREAVRGRTIWLVDDVHTSGATSNACAHTLKKAGAARVILLCWARVLHEQY